MQGIAGQSRRGAKPLLVSYMYMYWCQVHDYMIRLFVCFAYMYMLIHVVQAT